MAVNLKPVPLALRWFSPAETRTRSFPWWTVWRHFFLRKPDTNGIVAPMQRFFPPHPCDVKHTAAHFSYFLDRGNNFLICPEGARAKTGKKKKKKSLWNWLEERCILFKLEVKTYSKGEIISIFIKCQRVWLLDLPQATLGLKTFQQDLIDPDGLRLFLFFTPSTLLPPA